MALRIGFGVQEAVQKLVDAEASFENGMVVPGAQLDLYTVGLMDPAVWCNGSESDPRPCRMEDKHSGE